MTTDKTTRVQLELAPKSFERLTALKERTEAPSYAEVMKHALLLYQIVLDRTDAGESLCVRKPDGSIVELVIV
jgi:hypothetical protein